MKMKWIFCLLPMLATQALAQGVPPGCTPLVTIQSQGCFVRLVFTCSTDSQPLRWVASYGPNGPVSLTVLDLSGMPQVMMTGKEQPRGTLDPDGDPADLAKALSGEADSFAYQMMFDDGSVLSTSGSFGLTGAEAEVDGRKMTEFQRIETTVYPNGTTSPELENRLVYDAELGLLVNTTSTERATGKVLMDRTPVDFLFPGESGAESVAPLYGCEG